jgi:Fungal specific transcription factor domain/Fungal Zn(2)-Cys(6) binuclear cluster domain
MASNSPQGDGASSNVQPLMQQTGFSMERPSKRQKIAIACDTCRARKVRCDGLRPCGLCARRKDKGLACAYNRDKEKTVGFYSRTDHVPLQERQGPRSPSLLSSPLDRSLLTPLAYKQPPSQQNVINISASPALPESIPSPGGPQGEKSRGIDSMTGVVGDESTSQEFFGSSSAGSFMRQIKSAIDVKIGVPQNNGSETGASKSSLFQMSPPTQRIGTLEENVDYVLPSRKTADGLMDVYWTLVYPLYPFLNRKMFEDAYESIWSGSSPNTDERMLTCTMNVIFALGCQLSQSIRPEKREAQAKVYFKRAQDLLRLDLWDIGSTELIQCLLLMGQYLQSTNTPHQCWMVVGHAVRVAQSLGFHLPESSFGLQSAMERELARRIWHGCIMMDRCVPFGNLNGIYPVVA